MKKEKVTEVVPHKIYYRLVKTNRNLFLVEEVHVVGDSVVEVVADEETYLPIAFDKLRRKTAESFFNAIQENLK